MFMNATDGNCNIFYSGVDLIGLTYISSGIAILQDMYRFKKLKYNTLQNMAEILCHFGCNIKATNLGVSGMSGDSRLFANFPMKSDTKQSGGDVRDGAAIGD